MSVDLSRPVARRPMGRPGRSNTIGLVLSETLDNPLFAEFTDLLRLEAARQGYFLLLTQSGGDPRIERKRTLDFQSAHVAGLIVVSVLTESQLATVTPARRGIPMILIGRPRGTTGFHTVGPDYVSGAFAVVEHLIHHGHTNIAMVSGSSRSEMVEPREAGWRAAQKAAGLSVGPIGRGHFTRDAGHRIGTGLLSMRQRPGAVFAASDQIGLGVLRACQELGLEVPDDVAVASFDGSRAASFAWPPLTTARQPLHDMATAIISRLIHVAEPPWHQVFATKLTLGRSCGCP